jgi:ABC-type uncharacterized transport system ATPase subunit
VQAFLGMVLTLVARTYDVVLLDEPEAFLHPPQARLLGGIFVELSREGSQIVVATHSDDFLQGVLTASAEATPVTVARLTRPQPTINSVAQVSLDSLRKLYEDPLLRTRTSSTESFTEVLSFAKRSLTASITRPSSTQVRPKVRSKAISSSLSVVAKIDSPKVSVLFLRREFRRL